mgnify:CR=1 FL=1
MTNTWNPAVPPLSSPIPGDDSTFQSFRAKAGVMDEDDKPIAPDVSIGDFNARWAWIVQEQLKYYRPWSDAHQIIDIKMLLSGGYK